ncbi:hypothetical protein AAY473_035435 [Plecturocebus cupreus]
MFQGERDAQKVKLWPGTVAHACNPSILGGQDGVSLCHPGWSAIARSQLTATSASQVQVSSLLNTGATATAVCLPHWLHFRGTRLYRKELGITGLYSSVEEKLQVKNLPEYSLKLTAINIHQKPEAWGEKRNKTTIPGKMAKEGMAPSILQGAVAQACNPSTLGGRGRWITSGQEFKTSLTNMVKPPSLLKIQNQPGMVAAAYNPSYSGG